MNNSSMRIFVLLALTLFAADALAADSYRWLHVTIDTPWAIFIFLLPMVLIPVILMAILYWKFAGTKPTPPPSIPPIRDAADKE